MEQSCIGANRRASLGPFVDQPPQCPPVAQVHFFGSRVRGDCQLDSDIDVAVTMTAGNADSAFADFSFSKDVWMCHLSKLLSPWKVDLEWNHPGVTHTIQIGIRESSIIVFSRF